MGGALGSLASQPPGTAKAFTTSVFTTEKVHCPGTPAAVRSVEDSTDRDLLALRWRALDVDVEKADGELYNVEFATFEAVKDLGKTKK